MLLASLALSVFNQRERKLGHGSSRGFQSISANTSLLQSIREQRAVKGGGRGCWGGDKRTLCGLNGHFRDGMQDVSLCSVLIKSITLRLTSSQREQTSRRPCDGALRSERPVKYVPLESSLIARLRLTDRAELQAPESETDKKNLSKSDSSTGHRHPLVVFINVH